MNKPISQHWVPRFYLRYFATAETRESTNPQVWIFSKDGGDPLLTSTKNVAASRYLYSPPNQHGDRDWTQEEKLNKLETLLSRIWPELATDYLDLGSTSLRKGLSLFMATLMLRHPKRIDDIQSLHKRMVDTFDSVEKDHNGNPKVKQVAIGSKVIDIDSSRYQEYRQQTEVDHQRSLVEYLSTGALELAEIMLTKRWSMLISENPGFITTDNPFTYVNRDVSRSTYGINSQGTIIMFAISPTRILHLDDMHSEPNNQYYPLKNNDFATMNYLLWRNASRFMISHRHTDEVCRELIERSDEIKREMGA